MRESSHPLLIGLLVVLVLSMSTCPCVVSKAFADQSIACEAEPNGPFEQGTGSECPCCCKDEADGGDGDDDDKPSRCPCCARGSAGRDVAPVDAGIDFERAPDAGVRWFPDFSVGVTTQTDVEGWALEATGPPTALSPHGCPVGIVRLLN